MRRAALALALAMAPVFAAGPAVAADRLALDGDFIQGGLAVGHATPGATLRMGDIDVMVGDDGLFVIGFDRDFPETVELEAAFPDGAREVRTLTIARREYDIQRIDGLPPSKVTPRTPEQLKQIETEWLAKRDARANIQDGSWFAEQFVWPTQGVVSGVFGSQRVLNGEPRRPHYGLDVAAEEGASVRAPAGGVVVLAREGMYFEGGLIFLDHGHGLVSALMHLSRIDVAPGDEVSKGQIIGAVGATGRATGPHLHWGLQWAGQNVDPQLLLAAAGAAGAQ